MAWVGQRITALNDTIVNQHQVNGYDEFNRLKTMTASLGGNTLASYVYTYDRFGNRWSQTGGSQSFIDSFTTTTNQLTDAGYDAAGNMIQDPAGSSPRHTYGYDADGLLYSVDGNSTALYDYDSLGQRTRRQASYGTFQDVFDAFGRRVSEFSSANAFAEANINTDSGPIAYRTSGTTIFEHKNWIGTERLRTSYNGSVQSQITNLPFGDGYTSTAGQGDDSDFAELNRDQEINSEQALFREYSSTQGRWFSPDPYSGSYDITNPQSFNRYTYALNNPISSADPSGLDDGCGGSTDVIKMHGQAHAYDCPGGGEGGGGGGGDGGDGNGGGASGNTPCDPAIETCVNSGPITDPGDPTDPIGIIGTGYPSSGIGGGGGGGTVVAPNNPTQPGKQSKSACNAQRVANAIPGATLTGNNTFQGGHEEFGIQVSGADLAGSGFSFYSSPFGNGNGYRTPFSGAHVNGQPVNISVQYAYSETFAGQAHLDVGNAFSGFGGFAEHSFVDVLLGTLFGWIPGLHNFLDPGC